MIWELQLNRSSPAIRLGIFVSPGESSFLDSPGVTLYSYRNPNHRRRIRLRGSDRLEPVRRVAYRHPQLCDVVTAGDVIGYMGHTGYSTKENVNNIDTVHLHFGLQLIFDESQKEGNNEIWVDCYNLTRFLYKNRSAVQKVGESREWKRTLQMTDPAVVKYQKTVKKQ